MALATESGVRCADLACPVSPWEQQPLCRVPELRGRIRSNLDVPGVLLPAKVPDVGAQQRLRGDVAARRHQAAPGDVEVGGAHGGNDAAAALAEVLAAEGEGEADHEVQARVWQAEGQLDGGAVVGLVVVDGAETHTAARKEAVWRDDGDEVAVGVHKAQHLGGGEPAAPRAHFRWSARHCEITAQRCRWGGYGHARRAQ